MLLHRLVHRELNICHFLLRMSANFKTVWWFFTSLGKPKFDIISFLLEHFNWGLMPYLCTVPSLKAQKTLTRIVKSSREKLWFMRFPPLDSKMTQHGQSKVLIKHNFYVTNDAGYFVALRKVKKNWLTFSYSCSRVTRRISPLM